MMLVRSRTAAAQTSSICNRTRSHPLSLLSMARLNKARSGARCWSWSRTRIAQTSFGFRGRFCPVRRPLFQGTFCMIASIEPTAPPQLPPISGRGNLSERRVRASLPTFNPGMPAYRTRPVAVHPGQPATRGGNSMKISAPSAAILSARSAARGTRSMPKSRHACALAAPCSSMSAIISAISLPSNRGAATGGILAIPATARSPSPVSGISLSMSMRRTAS